MHIFYRILLVLALPVLLASSCADELSRTPIPAYAPDMNSFPAQLQLTGAYVNAAKPKKGDVDLADTLLLSSTALRYSAKRTRTVLLRNLAAESLVRTGNLLRGRGLPVAVPFTMLNDSTISYTWLERETVFAIGDSQRLRMADKLYYLNQQQSKGWSTLLMQVKGQTLTLYMLGFKQGSKHLIPPADSVLNDSGKVASYLYQPTSDQLQVLLKASLKSPLGRWRKVK